MTENKWPTKQSVSDAIDFATMEYQTAGARVIMEKTATLAEQVQADMMVVITAQAAEIERLKRNVDHMENMVVEATAEIERLTAENEALRSWLRGELTLADADIDAWLAREVQS